LTRWSASSADAPPATNQLSVLTGTQAFVGQNALRWNSTSGFDAWARYASPTPIDASSSDELRFAIKALNTTRSAGKKTDRPSCSPTTTARPCATRP